MMTTLSNRTKTALLVIDLQNAVIADAYQRGQVLAVVNTLVERARRREVPVIWIRHTGPDLIADTAAWQFVAELSPASGEPIIEKHYRDAFENTKLEETLSALGVGRIIVTGAQTDMCIRSTLHGALVRGYDATLVSDAHTTDDRTDKGGPTADGVISHTNMYWSGQSAPGRTGGIVESQDVKF